MIKKDLVHNMAQMKMESQEDLRNRLSWEKGNPITEASQMTQIVSCTEEKPNEIHTPIEVGAAELVIGLREDEVFNRLQEKVLSFGGDMVFLRTERFVNEDFIQHAQVWHGDKVEPLGESYEASDTFLSILTKMEEKQESIYVVKGFALQKNGIWMEHAWLLEEKEGKTILIDPCQSHLLYLGDVYTKEQTSMENMMNKLLPVVLNKMLQSEEGRVVIEAQLNENEVSRTERWKTLIDYCEKQVKK